MDWNFAIEKQKQALMAVLASLVAMAGIALGQEDPGPTIPRHLHSVLVRLIRAAESAARRLIVVAARGLVVELPPARKPKPRLALLPAGSRATGIVDTGISLRQLGLANVPPPRPRKPRDRARQLAFPLSETLRGLPRRPRRPIATSVPRIGGFDGTRLSERGRAFSPDQLLDARPIQRRLATIAHVLADLPGQARRFARWRALCDRAHARGVPHRVSPMRPGRPPGWCGERSRRRHEVHRVLDDLQGLAFWVLEAPDTS